jgi:hypothetical protein
MAFKNRTAAKKIAAKPCQWCGWTAGRRHAAHIVDEQEKPDINGISLCPNCSTVFDEKVRPMLYRALTAYGTKNLPRSWCKDNKLSF